jgi:outer membrane protein assembly factor BamB
MRQMSFHRMYLNRTALFLTTCGVLALSACSESEPILKGERLNVREVLTTRAGAETGPVDNQSVALSIPAAQSNANWTQSPVTPSARVANAALGTQLQPLFSTNIGAGDSRKQRLNTDPVVSDGRIFTMDANNVVRATSTGGEALWALDLTPARDRSPEGQGGGLAVGGGKLFASSGFGTLTAIDPATGATLWEQRLGNTATGAPSYGDGLVYVTSGETTGWAIEAEDGRVRWQIEGEGDSNNVAGAPAPAIGDQHVVFAFGSGSVQGAFKQGGLQLWNAELLGGEKGVTLAGIEDITGDPVIAGDLVYAGNHSGRVAAMNVYNGDRLWTADYGALGPMWPAGGSVFFVSDRNQLVRLNAETGATIWVVDLPGYVETRRPNKRRDAAYANMGPIMAGGRLMVASSDGKLRAFNPTDGALLEEVAIPGGATTRPVVAGNTLYVVSKKGELIAYR